MQTEIEAKWLNVGVEELRKNLIKVGAKLHTPERMMTRKIFDYPDKSLGKIGGWARVRTEGNATTMSYKQLNDRTLHGTKEVTLVVDNFDNACNFLESIGLESKSLQETKRESWRLGSVEIEIDTWPWIPTFVEIEAKNEKELLATADSLGLDYSKALHGSVETAYQAVYDVTEQEVDSWTEMKFIPVPKWLAKKIK